MFSLDEEGGGTDLDQLRSDDIANLIFLVDGARQDMHQLAEELKSESADASIDTHQLQRIAEAVVSLQHFLHIGFHDSMVPYFKDDVLSALSKKLAKLAVHCEVLPPRAGKVRSDLLEFISVAQNLVGIHRVLIDHGEGILPKPRVHSDISKAMGWESH